MLAPPNLGRDYAGAFNAIYPDLARASTCPLYPFFPGRGAAQRSLNQPDGIHPTAEGIAGLCGNSAEVEKLVAAAGAAAEFRS
jgi:acyl-CoA thioesterase-1